MSFLLRVWLCDSHSVPGLLNQQPSTNHSGHFEQQSIHLKAVQQEEIPGGSPASQRQRLLAQHRACYQQHLAYQLGSPSSSRGCTGPWWWNSWGTATLRLCPGAGQPLDLQEQGLLESGMGSEHLKMHLWLHCH